ncbi:MAG: L-serine ammonia-lyase [Pirellulaceae bacterium]|nr:L-serine ammonia-lyase [Pirellulaceae bacterium]
MHSIFDLFKIGIGPSSSHTVGPMIAALRFAQELHALKIDVDLERISVELYGSLALTGIGHGTDNAVIAGLAGLHPATVDIESMQQLISDIRSSKHLSLAGTTTIDFIEQRDILFHRDQVLPFHPNGLRFSVWNRDSNCVLERTFYSIGGGFVLRDDETDLDVSKNTSTGNALPPYPFTSADELMGMCQKNNLTVDQLVHQNELTWRTDTEIADGLDRLWQVMQECIQRGCESEGILPGGLGVVRRAPKIARKLAESNGINGHQSSAADPLIQLDWVSLFALAVNEENAAGGRVVTAPTNGAAGVIPAVLSYYAKFYPGSDQAGIHRFLKTAGAIGLLYKRNASLSAAEMGCQGEVGVACSMAAGGLAACMGGTASQIENAAEIGMEHCLGLTCDPVRGLVQVPCIERNTMGAVKAVNAARLAVLYGDGSHRVSLDGVIETMRQTGVDMQTKYKETSLGGLAVNVVNC